jgi:hypothetical protein
LPWHQLRFQHTQAIHAAVIDRGFSPATCDKALAALRGTLKTAWLRPVGHRSVVITKYDRRPIAAPAARLEIPFVASDDGRKWGNGAKSEQGIVRAIQITGLS